MAERKHFFQKPRRREDAMLLHQWKTAAHVGGKHGAQVAPAPRSRGVRAV
jgi:hypothetical protein